MEIVAGEKGGYELKVLSTNFVQLPNNAKAYFLGNGPDYVNGINSMTRSTNQIRLDIANAGKKRKQWKRIEGPLDVHPGYVKGITVKKYHYFSIIRQIVSTNY